MFTNDRYITKGVKETVDIEIQMVLWDSIDILKKKKGFKIDYLQVFELKCLSENNVLDEEITHTQEIPKYKKVYVFSTTKPVNTKIFVIDDGTNSTMMLAEEY